MTNQETWLLISALSMFTILGHNCCTEGAVLPRPPSSELQAHFQDIRRDPGSPTSFPDQNSLSLVIVTSSELPKQIPPPIQPLAHSSTPQYHEADQQVSALPHFKLLWVTRQMDTSNLALRGADFNTPSAITTQNYTGHRADLLPNMVWRKLRMYECVLTRNKRPKKVLHFIDLTHCFEAHATHRGLPRTCYHISKIWGFHGGGYEEWRLLGCYAVWLLYELTFRRYLAPPSSGWQESVN
jgi:hypothetical protein